MTAPQYSTTPQPKGEPGCFSCGAPLTLEGKTQGTVAEEQLLSRSLRGQAMSIAKVAYDEDWAEVVRLIQTGPSLNEPLALAKKEPGGLHASWPGRSSTVRAVPANWNPQGSRTR